MARESTPFPVVRLRGYDMGQVNTFVRAAAAERRRLVAENQALKDQLTSVSTELALRSDGLAMRDKVSPATLVTADQAASILAQAQRTAELTIAEARHQASETLRAAVERAEALAAASEQQLAQTREQVAATQARLVGLQALETEYRSRLRSWAAGVLTELDDAAPAPPAQDTTYRVDVQTGRLDFGDGVEGERPAPEQPAQATYTTGGGRSGNVAASVFDEVDVVLERVDEPDHAQGVDDADVVDFLDLAQVTEEAAVAPEAQVAAPVEQERPDRPSVVIPPGVLPEQGTPSEPARPAQSWFAPVGSPHRPAGV